MFIYPMWLIPPLPTDCDLPPTLYAMLNSIVNFGKDEKTKIEDLASAGRTKVFNFNYPLSSKVNKKDFEEMILNHFIMRRLGYETYTAWHIALKVKLNEIMPKYNKLFDALDSWDILEDGETITRTTNTTSSDVTNATNKVNTSVTTSDSETNSSNATNNVTTTSDSEVTSDRRYSDTPQNQLADVQSGTYVTEYNYDTENNNNETSTNGSSKNDTSISREGQSDTSTNGVNDSKSNGTRKEIESISRSPYDKINIYKEYMETIQSIYSMIFRDLDCLFYQLV